MHTTLTQPSLRRMFALTATAAVLLAATANAQSTVRPVPRIAKPLDWNAGGIAAPVAEAPRFDPLLTRYERLAATHEFENARRVEVEAFGQMLPGASLETGGGEVETARFGWRARLLQEMDSGATLGFALENEASFYDFGLSNPLVGTDTDPFNDVYLTRLASTYYGQLSTELAYFGGAEIVLAGEPDAGLEASTTFGATTGFAYRAHEDLEVTVGLFAYSRLEDDAVLLPFIGLAWRITDGLELNAEGNRVALDAELTDAVDLELYATYDQRQFRLEDGGGLESPALRDEQIDIGATFGIALTEAARLEIGAGYTTWRELTVLNDGAALGEVELDPQPFATLGLSVTL